MSNVESDGWVKGWLLNTPNRNIILTASHCSASSSPPTNIVRVYKGDGTTVTRKIVAVEPLDYSSVEPNMKDSVDANGKKSGDLTICRINKPFPTWAKGYDFATKAREGQPFTILTRDQGTFKGHFHVPKDIAWVSGYETNRILQPGVSGLPWFVYEDDAWKVVTHTTLGGWGGGIHYMHKKIKADLLTRIQKLSQQTS